MTWNVWPAIVAVPLRAVVAVFAPILNVTLPLPLPPAPAVTMIQVALLTAVHEQFAGALTETLVDPAAAGTDALVADKVNVHAAPA